MNGQISVYIDEAIQAFLGFVNRPHALQVGITILGLWLMFSFIVYIVTKVVNDVVSNEYIELEHDEYED